MKSPNGKDSKLSRLVQAGIVKTNELRQDTKDTIESSIHRLQMKNMHSQYPNSVSKSPSDPILPKLIAAGVIKVKELNTETRGTIVDILSRLKSSKYRKLGNQLGISDNNKSDKLSWHSAIEDTGTAVSGLLSKGDY